MNQLLGQGNQQAQGRSDQPHAINVNVVVNLQSANLNLQLSIDPKIPFNLFVNGIKEQIFAQRMQAQYEETIEYQFENGSNLQQNETRTLQQLGFTNNCTLNVRLRFRNINFCSVHQTALQKKRIYKIVVDFQIKQIQFDIAQFENTPASNTFHDILIQLYQSKICSVIPYFTFFIKNVEIDCFDTRLLQEFQLNQGIKLKIVPPNLKPSLQSIEKSNFAQSTLNVNDLSFNIIKNIECKIKVIKISETKEFQISSQSDVPLREILNYVIEYQRLKTKQVTYFINFQQQISIHQIYSSKNIDIKVEIKDVEKESFTKFYAIGTFRKKVIVKGKINQDQQFSIEEFIPIETQESDHLKYIKQKIFGSDQSKYDEQVRISNNYIDVQFVDKKRQI